MDYTKISNELNKRRTIYALLLIILIVGVYFRIELLKYPDFYSPDGFFKYAVLEQAVLHNYSIPKDLIYSGFPIHNYISNRLGGYFVTLYPYMILKLFGVSLYTTMRAIPILFGLLDILGVYLLALYLSKNRFVGLLAAFLIAVLPGNFEVTAASVYRGDIFISIFAILSIVFFIKVFNESNKNKKYLYAIISPFILGIGSIIWGGNPFVVAIYMLAIIMVVVLGFIELNKEYLKGSLMLSASLIIEYLMEHLFVYLTIIRSPEFLTGTSFFIFYVPILVGTFLAFEIVDYKLKSLEGLKKQNSIIQSIFKSKTYRFTFVVVIFIVALSFVSVEFSGLIKTIATGGGLVSAVSPLGHTIEELEPPTLSFLWASFNISLVFFLVGVVLYIFYSQKFLNNTKGFKPKFDSNNISVSFLAIFSYLLITGYLQSQATRYNSLLSIPLVVFSAYGIFYLGKIFYEYSNYQLNNGLMYRILGNVKFVYYGLISGFIIISLMYAFTYLYSMTPSNGMGFGFMQILSWVHNNTPSNSTFLAAWPDGSGIEYAERYTVTDSVAGQNALLIAGFSKFLFNDTSDIGYLKNVSEPDYIFERYYWLYEMGGLEYEGLLVNTSNKSDLHLYTSPKVFDSKSYNYSATLPYKYGEPAKDYYDLVYNAPMVTSNGNIASEELHLIFYYNVSNPNDSAAVGYIGDNKSAIYTIKHVVILNNDGMNNYVINNTKNYLNFTLIMVTNGGSVDASSPINGMLLGKNMFRSNFMKLELCTPNSCDYGNSSVTAKVVYQNGDGKIIKLSYANDSN